MYFFRKRSPSGVVTQLLEAYRDAQGRPRTRLVASLGDVVLPQGEQVAIAMEVEARLYHRPLLLPSSPEVASWADRIVRVVQLRGRWRGTATAPGEAPPAQAQDGIDGVIPEKVSHTQTTSLGPELVGLRAWEDLGMPGFLASLGFNPSQVEAAGIQVVGRLVRPGSELELAESLLHGSSLADLLASPAAATSGLDRFYRVSDKLLAHRTPIEAHLRRSLQRRLSLHRTYYLYDLTNTHFEGLCRANPKAKRGKSKQERHDCPLVAAGVCFDEHGFVLFHQTFAGNTHDSVTLPEMIRQMQLCSQADDLLGVAQPPVVIVDGGLASAANLAALRAANLRYLVNRTRSARSHYAEAFAQTADFTPVPGRAADAQVFVRQIPDPEQPGDRLILCHSQARGEKEQAMRSGAETRYLRDLDKLRDRIAKGRLKAPDKIQQAIGRAAARHPRVARYYEVKLDAASRLTYQRADEPLATAAAFDGRYVLQTNIVGGDAVGLWQHYIILTRAEDGFRALKSHLGLRPNYHHREHRVDGHIFITILAYQLLRYITHRLAAYDDHRNWPTLRAILQTHCYTTITLPTTHGTTWTIRCPGQPEAAHRLIYHRLGIDHTTLPKTTTSIPTTPPRNP